MRRPLVVGNWKMHGRVAEAEALVRAIATAEVDWGRVEAAVCPPFPLIERVARGLRGSAIAWGAQDLHWEDSGAFTGDVAGPMLQDLGCTYVIIGHSERRHGHGEDNATVAHKFFAAKRNGLIPILCLGETQTERDAGRTEEVVGSQLNAISAEGYEAPFREAVIAYEPVWAIGTGRTATPEQAQQVHTWVREQIRHTDPGVADAVRLLYGGSMKEDSASELMAQPDIDGGLIGGASLKADQFIGILRAASRRD